MSKQRDSPYSVQGVKRKGNNGVKGSEEEKESSPFLRQSHDNWGYDGEDNTYDDYDWEA